MRLNAQQRATIKAVTTDLLGTDAKVLLFGSRVDDAERGGDIDLLVLLERPVDSRVALEARLAGRIEAALGGQRTDVLLTDPNTALQPVHRAALSQGVPL